MKLTTYISWPGEHLGTSGPWRISLEDRKRQTGALLSIQEQLYCPKGTTPIYCFARKQVGAAEKRAKK